jgi:hypothetical protein
LAKAKKPSVGALSARKVKVASAELYWKAVFPMDVTLPGIVREVRPVQPKNTPSSMV